MESDAEGKIHEWAQHWIDLSDFQIIRVLTSAQAKEKVNAS
jgi:hypothetical protein